MRCPYCNGPIENKIEHLPMSAKRRAILDCVLESGQEGISRKEIVDRFFSEAQSKTTLRTTLHYINKAIAPLRIYVRGGVVHLSRDRQA